MDRKELIANAILSVKPEDVAKEKGNMYPVGAGTAFKFSEKQLANARSLYAPGISAERTVALVDLTIMSSGKKGFLFTEDAFYADKSKLTPSGLAKQVIPMPIRYDELEEVSREEKQSYLILKYKDGRVFRVFVPVYTLFLYQILDGIIKALREEEDVSGVAAESGEPGQSGSEEAVADRAVEEAESEAEGPKADEPERQEREELQAEGENAGEKAAEGEDAAEKAAQAQEQEAQELERRFQAQRTAAELGNPEAEFSLGLMYEEGKGTEADLAQALHWYEQAAEHGHVRAPGYCGYAYWKGRGTQVDYDKAFYWYERGAEQGQMHAQFGLGRLYGDEAGNRVDDKLAFYWLQRSAEQGYKKAQVCCGELYNTGKGTPKDDEKAIYWYEKAAQQGEALGQANCGIMYYNGIGTEKDLEKAFYWHEKAAQQGQAISMAVCGSMYEKGEGTEKNLEKAFYWHKKAAEQGNVYSMAQCGTMYYYGEGTDKDREQSLYWREQAAMEGDADAAYDCGLMYEDGIGTEKNVKKALYWYGKAAEGGDEDALYAYEELSLESDEGGEWYDIRERLAELEEKAEEKARAEAQAAASVEGPAAAGGEAEEKDEEKDAEKQYEIALAYRDGKGMRADPAQAVRWLRKCAMQDYGPGQQLLGIIYYRGDYGMPEEQSRGAFWLREARLNGSVDATAQALLDAEDIYRGLRDQKESPEMESDREELYAARARYAEAGRPESQYRYGCMFEDGEAVKQDKEKALYWYERAAEQGYAPAQYRCGELYRRGEGTGENPKKALSLYKKAARQGHMEAQYQCGLMYEAGNGTKADREKAMEWYRKAAYQGHGLADEKCGWIGMYDDPEGIKVLKASKILVCSGSPFARTTLMKILKESGIGTVSDASSEEDALDTYRKAKPDLVIADNLMAGQYSFEAAEKLAQTWPKAKIILYCEKGLQSMAGALRQKYGSGIVGTVCKPLEKKELLALVAKELYPGKKK